MPWSPASRWPRWPPRLSTAPVAAEVRNPNGAAVIVGSRDYRMDHARRVAEAFKHYVLDFGGVRPTSMWAADKATAGGDQLASWGEEAEPGLSPTTCWTCCTAEGTGR